MSIFLSAPPRARQTAPIGTARSRASLPLELAWKWHASIMTVVTLGLVLASGSVTRLSGMAEIVLLTVSVALLGVPHGALDHLIARPHLRPLLRAAWMPVFLIAYLSGVGLVLLAWQSASVITLTAFLIVSVYHFGEGDVVASRYTGTGELPLMILWRGLLVIGLPIAHHVGVISHIFAALLPGILETHLLVVVTEVSRGISPLLAVTGLAALTIALRPAPVDMRRLRLWDAFESLALFALFWVAPPLVALLVYFCGWHSLRHTLHLAAELGEGDVRAGSRVFLWHALPLTVATLTLAALGYIFAGGAQIGTEVVLLRIVFYGLSALTLPHMFLLAWSHTHAPSGDRSRK